MSEPGTCRRCGKPFVGRKGRRYCSRECQVGNVRVRLRKGTPETATHLIIPDTQVKAGVPNDHLAWINRYAKERYHNKPLTIIHLGDHWDMPSLCSYDKGKGAMEGRRYNVDVAAGNRGFNLLTKGWADEPLWHRHFLFGNHEDRITRAIESDVQLDGLLSLEHLETPGFKRHGFLEVINLDGIYYSHYFVRPLTGRPLAGENVDLRIKTLGHSFVQGHQQTLMVGMRYSAGRQQLGIVAGACYQHDEDYLGPQGNAQWRGIVVLNNVDKGSADPMFVGLDYLCRRFEGRRLADHTGVEK